MQQWHSPLVFGPADPWHCGLLTLSIHGFSVFCCATVLLPKKDALSYCNPFPPSAGDDPVPVCAVLNFYSRGRVVL